MKNTIDTEKIYMEKNHGQELNWYESCEFKKMKGFEFIDRIDFTNKKVLDLGAYTGWLGYEAYKRGGNIILLDIFSDAFLNIVKIINSERLIGIIGDKESLLFSDNIFDYIITSNILHHGDLKKTSLEIHRVLKSGGTFISIQEPCISSDKNEMEILLLYCKEQLDAGIDERRPNYFQYRDAFLNFSELSILSGLDFSRAFDGDYGDGIIVIAKK